MTGKRHVLGRGKGYLSAAGAQYRFIVFFLVVLGCYTFLLKVFQKLAEILQLPVFLPIALITLLSFVGIVGTIYSHTFIGPLLRIRRVLEHLTEGDPNVSLRLRDSDDPILKDLGKALSRLCDCSRSSHAEIRETAKNLFAGIEALREKVRQGADSEEVLKHLEGLLATQALLEKAVRSYNRK